MHGNGPRAASRPKSRLSECLNAVSCEVSDVLGCPRERGNTVTYLLNRVASWCTDVRRKTQAMRVACVHQDRKPSFNCEVDAGWVFRQNCTGEQSQTMVASECERSINRRGPSDIAT